MTDKIDVGQLREVEISKELLEELLYLGENTLISVRDSQERHTVYAMIHCPSVESVNTEGTLPRAWLQYKREEDGSVSVEVVEATE